MRILPFNDMQNGYRHIALKTEGNYPMSLPMIFVQFEIKIYVPDGLGDFMDALCDPRAFMSAQEKRAEQMKAMGIEEDAVEETAAPEAKKDATKAGGLDVKGKPGPGQAKKAEDPKKEDYSSVLKPITGWVASVICFDSFTLNNVIRFGETYQLVEILVPMAVNTNLHSSSSLKVTAIRLNRF